MSTKMLILIFAVPLLAIVSGHELDRLAGTWNYIASYTSFTNIRNQDVKVLVVPVDGDFKCVCDGIERTFPAVNSTIIIGLEPPSIKTIPTAPVRIVESTDDAETMAQQVCVCPNLKGVRKTAVFRFINDNYVLVYDRVHDFLAIGLWSKLRDDEDALRSVIDSDDELRQLDARVPKP